MSTALNIAAGASLGHARAQVMQKREADIRAAWDSGFEAGKEGRFVTLLVGIACGAGCVGLYWLASALL